MSCQIDRKTFAKVQERIQQNRREGGRKKAKTEYLLTGKAFCGYCGSAINSVSGRGRHGDMHYYYYYRGRRKGSQFSKKHEKKILWNGMLWSKPCGMF